MQYNEIMKLVFAHFGSPVPKHLLLNLERCTALFPDHEIFLITDTNLKMKNVVTYNYTAKEDWWILYNHLKHSKTFRNNFWFTSSARFLAIADFSKSIEGDFLHIESDVIIAEDFPFKSLSNSNYDIIFPIVSDSTAIASCLYVRNWETANYLGELTLSESQKNNLTTDMYILSILSKEVNLKFSPMPTAPSNYYLRTESNTRFLQFSDIAATEFGGFFDGADIGRYLFGDDPRNRRGYSILRDNDTGTYLDVRDLNLVTKPEREFPYIQDGASNSYVPLYSLHIHSKNLDLFRVDKSKKLIHYCVSKSKDKSKKVFVFSVFLNSAFKALKIRVKNLASGV
jgi:hypothetical protein